MKEQTKILSVSIAAYNAATTLVEALQPFTQDDVRYRVDVMIVDDGSKDDTAKIAAQYEKDYPGTFRLISKENGGWGSTLNVGIQAACGRYFKQLDGDDYYSAENLSLYLDFLGKTDADMVYSPFVTFRDDTGAVIRLLGRYHGDYRFFPIGKTVPIVECNGFMPAMHSMAVRSAVLKENHITLTEHCFYTDLEFVVKAYSCCNTVTFFESPVYYYRLARNGQSMSQAGVRKHYMDHRRMLAEILRFYTFEIPDFEKKKLLEDRISWACTMQYVFFMALECNAKQKQELREFDAWLKSDYPYFYEKENGKQIRFLRKTNFWGYKFVSLQKMQKDRRLKRNIFEGA